MFHNQYSSYHITGVMIAANMRLTEHAACKRGLRNQCDIIVMESERKPTFYRMEVDGKIILKLFL